MIDPALLRRLPLLEGVSDAAIEELARRSTLRRLSAGQVLWTAGGEVRGLHLILDGSVRVVRAAGGRQHLVHTEGPGGTLGEVPLFAGGGYPATALAVEKTVCVVVGRDVLEAAMAIDAQLAWVFLHRLGGRVRELVDRLERITVLNVSGRLADMLLARADDGGIVRIDSPQWRLAEDLGTVREVIVRAFRDLRKAGLIRPAGRRRWEILDAEGLRVLTERG